MRVLNEAFGDYSFDIEARAAMPLAGGIMQHGFQCGLLWGAVFGAGARAYRLYGPDSRAEKMAVLAAQKLVESFRSRYDSIDCSDITSINKSSTGLDMILYFILKGGTLRCFRMAARYAQIAQNEIKSTDINENELPDPPVSCAALLAKKVGATDAQMVMAAGCAGGIGLSGGACGALGAAIWLKAIKQNENNQGRVDFNDPECSKLIARFVNASEGEFECSVITGRKFKNIDDHAAYLRDGGCLQIIENLAAES